MHHLAVNSGQVIRCTPGLNRVDLPLNTTLLHLQYTLMILSWLGLPWGHLQQECFECNVAKLTARLQMQAPPHDIGCTTAARPPPNYQPEEADCASCSVPRHLLLGNVPRMHACYRAHTRATMWPLPHITYTSCIRYA